MDREGVSDFLIAAVPLVELIAQYRGGNLGVSPPVSASDLLSAVVGCVVNDQDLAVVLFENGSRNSLEDGCECVLGVIRDDEDEESGLRAQSGRGTIRREVTIPTDIGASPALARRVTLAAILGAVFIVGVVTRIDGLASSLWLDEFGTFWVAEGSFATMLRRCWEFQGQSPLYYSLAWLSLHSFGESEIALRAPSLLLSCLTVGLLYQCARMLDGARAGLFAAALIWLSAHSIRYSVSARPYMLVLCAAAVAIAGFVRAVRSGSLHGRILWIVGGAAVAWAHYVHYPMIVGLFIAYALLPSLRVHYSIRAFVTDAALQLVLVGLCAPQIFALFTRRGTLSWIDEPSYAIFLEPLLPLIAGIAVGLSQPPRRGETGRIEAALAKALLICVLFQIGVIESASTAGINLLDSRYLVSILVPAILFVAVTLARVSTAEAIAILTAFAVLTAAPLVRMKKATGTFSGAGFENWRDAVSDLSSRIRNDTEALVFFRSGFVEDDTVPLGVPPPTTRAPLRSPGQKPFPVAVVPLNYRWLHPSREKYFDERLAPIITTASHFYVLGTTGDPGVGDYMELFARWVESRWPSRFVVVRTHYGRVELLEFRAQPVRSDGGSSG
jgi:hypothetical protein